MPAADDDQSEVRLFVPREIASVIDAHALPRNMKRPEAINEILRQWAKQKVHEHIIFARVTKGNPLLTQSSSEDSL